MRLSSKDHWDALHSQERKSIEGIIGENFQASAGIRSKVVRLTKRWLSPRLFEQMSSYDDFVLWKVIFKTFLPDLVGRSVLEVGSAPGEFLVEMASRYECVPYGIDYSKPGVELNRLVFKRGGLNPENVIHGDLFSEEIQERYKDEFDVVLSRGFVEHFADVPAVIEKHVGLLKPGGHLIITIPNIAGANYLMTRIFNPDLIPIHNLEIMDRENFRQVFYSQNLEELFCGYYGIFNFNLFYSRNNALLRFVLKTLQKTQPPLNLLFRTVAGNRIIEFARFSPSLVFIGVKR